MNAECQNIPPEFHLLVAEGKHAPQMEYPATHIALVLLANVNPSVTV